MVFSSLVFIFWFLPIFFTIYYIAKGQIKNAVLLFGSIVFYAWGEPKYLPLIFISIIVNYLAGIIIGITKNKSTNSASDRRVKYDYITRFVLGITLIYDFGCLFVFKYTDFFIANINSIAKTEIPLVQYVLPLGISFYTFQIASYVIDVYKGEVAPCKNIISLATYLCMFPQLIAGPIVVYSDVEKELRERIIAISDINDGIRIFILGLASKVLIANNVGALWNDLEAIKYENISMPLAWMGVVAYTLQIYFDFNGYSLMAIGLGKCLGFKFPKNFDFPYISKSLTEFWRRWHITLSSWFRNYIYIPLGGNRKGNIRTVINLFIVWFLTGFWHGAGWNFILWGLFFFVMLTVEKNGLHKILERNNFIARIYALVFIGLSWMIFAITDMSQLVLYFKRLFSFEIGNDFIYYLRNYFVILLLGVLFSTPVFKGIYEKNKNKLIGVFCSVVLFVLSVAYLVDATYNPFLYFRF